MHPVSIAVIVFSILFVGFILWLLYQSFIAGPKRQKAKREAKILEQRQAWLEQYQASIGDDHKLSALHKPHKDWSNEETDQAYEEVKNACLRNKERREAEDKAKAEKFYQRLRKETDPRSRWILLMRENAHGFANATIYDDGDVSFANYLHQGVVEFTAQLLAEARDGSSESFKQLSKLIFEQGRAGISVYNRIMSADYSIPDDWDELVATLFEHPSADLFFHHKYEPNAVALAAVEALESRNIVLAKALLAYSMVRKSHVAGGNTSSSHTQLYWPYRDAIGPIHMAQLAEMVSHLHHERGLFQHETDVAITS